MKRLIIVLFAIASLAATAEAQSNITLKVKGVRSNNGMIMVMGETGKENPPVYAMVKAQKGDVTVVLSNVKGEKVNISLFHDENGDSQLERLFYGKAVGGKGGKEFSHAYVVSMIFGLYTVKRDLVTGLLHFIFHLFFVLLFIFPNAGIIRAAFAIRIYAMFHDGF